MSLAYGEQTTLSWRKRRAGQRLMIGIQGSAPSPELRAFVREATPGGFILFARNVEDPAQVLELNRELTSLLPVTHPPLLGVDQEGGRVQRIKVTSWPRARWVGNVDDPRRTRALAAAMTDELLAVGFNVNFAPDCDVDSNPKNPVIGDRAYGNTPAAVIRHAVPTLEVMQDRGLIACAKHFPGHGDTEQDSHHDLPRVEKELPDLREVELRPFRAAVQAGVGMVMSSHVVFPALDEDWPATMSPPVLRGLLREELGFGGVLVSDDMEMKAVAGRYPLEQQLERATRATVDLFLFCHELDLQWQAWETLIRLMEQDRTLDRLSEDSERRILSLRERFLKDRAARPELSVLGSPAHQALAHAFKMDGMA